MSHYSPIVAALVTMLLTTLILISKFGKEIPDIPNERSLHGAPVLRIAGVALMQNCGCGGECRQLITHGISSNR